MNISELLLYDAKWWLDNKNNQMLKQDNLTKVLAIREKFGYGLLSNGKIIDASFETECMFNLLICEAIK